MADSVLSLCHGRPPIVSNGDYVAPESAGSRDTPLPYREAMRGLVAVIVEVAKMGQHLDLDRRMTLLAELDNSYAAVPPRLRSRSSCKTLQDITEFYSLKMHVSFTASMLCRPAAPGVRIRP